MLGTQPQEGNDYLDFASDKWVELIPVPRTLTNQSEPRAMGPCDQFSLRGESSFASQCWLISHFGLWSTRLDSASHHQPQAALGSLLTLGPFLSLMWYLLEACEVDDLRGKKDGF